METRCLMRKPRCAVNKGTHDFIRTGVVWGMIGCFVMAAHATTNNLVHHWNFDEGQDWHDSAFATQSTNTLAWDFVGTAHAALTGMDSTNWVSGRQFTAVAFDGVNDYLAVTNNLALTLGGTASLSFWIKTTQAGTASAGTSPGVAGVAGSGGAQWGWIDNVGRIGLAFDNATVVQSTNSIADGNWHYVVLTRLSTGARTCNLYVDGVLHASAQGPSGPKSSAFYSLGRIENGGTPVYFAGRLDQIHVYNQVLALADVQSLQTNHAPKCWDVTTEGVTNRTFTTESIYERTYDVERDTCAVTRWTQPARGTVTYNGDGSFKYTHTPGEAMGSDLFAVEVGDGRGGYHRANLRVVTMAESTGGGMPITQYANFAPIQTNGVDVSFASWRIPRLMDWDQDGDLDLLVGVSGAIWRWTNTGTASSPAFTTRTQVQANGANITAGTGCIALIDMNGNGVRDLVAIDSSRRLILYVNTRAVSQSPVYSAGTYILHSSGSNFIVPESSFDLGDWNGDGLPDLATGTGSGTIRLYLNVGTAAAPRYNDTYTSLVSNSYNLYPRLFDVNGNGKTDFIHGINWGSITYYRDPFDRGLSGANFAITDSSGATLDMHSLLNGACVDFADLNNDGKLDIICGGNGGTDKIFVGYGVLRSVQESLTDIEAIYNVDTNNVGITLSANTNLLLNAVNTANWNLIARIQHGTLGAREELYSALTNHIAKYGFLKYQAHDVSKFHHVPSIVLMNWVMLTYAIPDTPTRRVEIANVMGLTNTMRTVYLEQGLAIGDAGTSYDATYRTVRDFMRRHPRELFPDCILTIDQLNGDGRGGFIWTPNSTKNTFGQWALGNANEWAGDLTTAIEKVLGAGKASGDYFTFVMGHEVTHSLDGYVNARANQDLRKRWGLTLCTAAGPDVIPGSNGWWDWTATKANFQAKGYWDGVEANWDAAWTAYWETGPGSLFKNLSFMRFDISWFMGAPQESLATQANHHWANGPGRLIGATDRFRRASAAGYGPMKANINEVATFIDYLSGGMNRVNLVETKNLGGTDEYVNWVDHYAELERNDKGYLQQIKVDDMTFRFALADNGVVTNVFTSLINLSADDAWTFRNTPCVIEVLANDMNLEGGGVFQIMSVTQPANGTVVKNGDGTVTYTSTGSFTGFDTFSYTATTAEGGSATALVRVEVVNPAIPSGSLLVEYWNSLSGSSVSSLTGYANFPMSPSEKYYTNSVFELRKDFRENYGTRVRTLLVPNATGDYKFWIASDDNSELWLSTNHEPQNKQRIAYVGDWTSSREWTKYASQESVEIPLVAGRSYYIETLQKEGSGGDNLAVAWAGPDIFSSTNVIPSANLRHPFSSYTEKKSVQWFKNGSGAWDTISSNWTANGSVATTFVEDDSVTLPDIGGLPSATLTLAGDYLLSSLSVPAQTTAYTIGGGFALQTPTFSKSGSGTFEIVGALSVTAEAVTNLSGTITMGSLTTPGLALAQSAQATFNALYTPSLIVAQNAQVTVTDPLSQLQGITLNSGGLLIAPASAILSGPTGAGTLRLSSGTYRFGSSAFSAGTLDVTAGARGEVLYTATMPVAGLSGAGTFAFVSSQSATVDPVPGNPVIAVPDFAGTLSLETLGAMRLNAFTAGNWKSWIESLPSTSTLAFGKGMQYFGPVCTLNSRLLFENNAQVANTYQDSGGSFGQWRFGPGTALFNNTVNLGTNSHIRFGNHDTCTLFFQASIAGTNSLLEFGSGYPSLSSPLTIHLKAANTHALTQVRNSGGAGRVTLHLWHAEALGGGLRSVTSGSGGACAVNIGASTTAVDVVVASLEGTNSADVITLAHPDSSLLVDGEGVSSFPGVLAGAGALLKSGNGTLILAGNNTLGLFNFSSGTVVPKHANALGTNSLLALGGTCALDLTQSGAVVPTAPLGLTLTETPSITMAYNAATDMTVASISGAGKVTLAVNVSGLASFGDYRLLNAPGVLSSNAFDLVLSQALPANFKAALTCANDGVYLRVTPVTVALTLDAQGGTVSPGTTNILHDSAYGVLPAPVRAGFSFCGWWTEPYGLGTQVVESTMVTNMAAHTLYARWMTPNETPITWSTPVTVSGTNDVLKAGIGIFAYTAGTATTVNGVPFTSTLVRTLTNNNMSVSGFTGDNVAAFTYGSGTFAALPTDYKNMLIGATYNLGEVTTVVLSNLTVGARYYVQIWISDPRGSTRTASVMGAGVGGNTVTVDYTVPDAAGNPGQYAIGSFTAGSATQTFTIDGNQSSQLNAIQLRYATYVMDANADSNWWGTAAWNGITWANRTEVFPSYAYLNVGNVSPTIWVTNAADLASSDILLDGLYVKGSSGAVAINGSNMTFTGDAPFVDIRTMNAATAELRVRNTMKAMNPLTFFSVGTEFNGSTATGGIRFEKTPALGTVRVKSGQFLVYDAAVDTFMDTVILDGGGLCSQAKNTGFNFPVKVGAAGGWWRTYAAANMIVGGPILDEAPGVTGEFRHTDAGAMTLTNSLADFHGTLRNNAGTLVLTKAALNFSGQALRADATVTVGSGDAVGDYSFAPAVTGSSTLNIALKGNVQMTNALTLGGSFNKNDTAWLKLAGGRSRTMSQVYVNGGTLELADGSLTTTGGSVSHGGNFIQNGGAVTVPSSWAIGTGTNVINDGTFRATHLDVVNQNGRYASFHQNGGMVTLTSTNTVVNSSVGGTASAFRIGHWPSAKGNLVLNGGEFRSENMSMNIAWDSAGQVDITNGTMKCYAIMVGVPNKTTQGDLKMYGGILKVGAGGIYRRASNAAINFFGGTLASAAPFTINGVITLGDSADDLVAFDTAEGMITAPSTIAGSGKLVKTGTGKLRFSALQTALQVNAGEVEPTYYAVSVPSISSTASGATFDVQLASAAAGVSTKYTASGDITLADGTLFDVTLYQGRHESGVPYTLMESTGGTITTNGHLRAPYFDASRSAVAFTLSGDGKKLYMTVTSAPYTLYWKRSDATGTWNITDVAWSQNPGATTPDEIYQEFDNVVFPDVTGQSAVEVTISPLSVSPKGIMVTNTSTTYTLKGAGLAAVESLVKTGSGSLVYSTPWHPSGLIAVNGGTLDWRDGVSFSASNLTVASGATFKQNATNSVILTKNASLWSGASLVLGAGTFNITAGANVDPLGVLRIEEGFLRCAGAGMSKPFTVAGASGGVDFRQVSNATEHYISGQITGTGNLTVYGNGDTSDSGGGVGGSTILSNTGNAFTGQVILASGVVNAESIFGAAANPVVLNGGGTVRKSGAITLNRDLWVGSLGGVLRCYGNLANQQIWTGKFGDRTVGVTGGDVRATDGGTIQFTGDISGFTGNYRKVAGGGRLLIGNGGALPCDTMRWASIYINGDRVAFNLSNTDFKVGFGTTGNGALYKQGSGTLVWTNNIANAIAHTGGTFIEGGTIRMQDATQFADNTTINIAPGATLERLATTAMNTGINRKIAGGGTFKLTLAADCGANIYTNSTGFNGLLDLSCSGAAKILGLATNQFGGNTTLKLNTGALWYIANNQVYPYSTRIAGIGNTEVGGAYSFGALRLESNPTLTGAIALIDDARIYGTATLRGVISNDCPTVKTLAFGGTYAQGHTMNLYGSVLDGRAPMNLAFTQANTFNFYATNSVAAVTNNNSTLNIKTGAKLSISQPTGGAGAWHLEGNAVLGLVVNGTSGGCLNASTLTWNTNAKIAVAGLNTTSRTLVPLIQCPSGSISDVPQLAEELPRTWTLVRIEQLGVATIYAKKISGTMFIFTH